MRTHNRSGICRRPGRLLVITGLVTSTMLPSLMRAQASAADSVRDTTHSQKQAPFFTHKDLVMAGLFAGATLLAAPFDRRTAQQLQDPGTQANRVLKNVSTGVEAIASPGAYVIGGGLYAVGRIGGGGRPAALLVHRSVEEEVCPGG